MDAANFIKVDIIDALDRILARISRHPGLMAVFVVNGRARTTPVDSELFLEAMRSMPQALLGVYSQWCPPGWLLQDLEFAEKEMA